MIRPDARAPRPTSMRRRLVHRRAGLSLVLTAFLAGGALAACSDGSEEPPVTAVSETTLPAGDTSSSTPSGGGDSGAKPGRNPEDLEVPGGTTPVPDSGGATSDDSGDQSPNP